jgi:hypothetical protein
MLSLYRAARAWMKAERPRNDPAMATQIPEFQLCRLFVGNFGVNLRSQRFGAIEHPCKLGDSGRDSVGECPVS